MKCGMAHRRLRPSHVQTPIVARRGRQAARAGQNRRADGDVGGLLDVAGHVGCDRQAEKSGMGQFELKTSSILHRILQGAIVGT